MDIATRLRLLATVALIGLGCVSDAADPEPGETRLAAFYLGTFHCDELRAEDASLALDASIGSGAELAGSGDLWFLSGFGYEHQLDGSSVEIHDDHLLIDDHFYLADTKDMVRFQLDLTVEEGRALRGSGTLIHESGATEQCTATFEPAD